MWFHPSHGSQGSIRARAHRELKYKQDYGHSLYLKTAHLKVSALDWTDISPKGHGGIRFCVVCTYYYINNTTVHKYSHYFGCQVQCWSWYINCHQSYLSLSKKLIKLVKQVHLDWWKWRLDLVREQTCRAGHDRSSWRSAPTRCPLWKKQ